MAKKTFENNWNLLLIKKKKRNLLFVCLFLIFIFVYHSWIELRCTINYMGIYCAILSVEGHCARKGFKDANIFKEVKSELVAKIVKHFIVAFFSPFEKSELE